MSRPGLTLALVAAVLAGAGRWAIANEGDETTGAESGALTGVKPRKPGIVVIPKGGESTDGGGADVTIKPYPMGPLPGEKPEDPQEEPPMEFPTPEERDGAAERARAGEEVLNQYPPDPVSSGRLARDYMRGGDPAGAERVLDRLIDAGQGNADAYRLRSGARFQNEDWKGAYTDARNALSLNPGDKVAAELAGTSRMQLQRLGIQAPEVKQGKLREEDNQDQASQQRAAQAPEDAQSFTGANPVPLLGKAEPGTDPRLALFAAIDRKVAIGGGREALLDLSRYIDRNPQDAAAYGKRAYVLNRGKNPKAALADSERALTLDPNDPSALREAAYALIQLGQASRALPLLERAIGLQPKNGLGYLYRAMARSALGEHDAALADYAKAAALDPALQSYYDEALGGAHKKSAGTAANWRVRGLVGLVAAALLVFGLWNALRGRTGQTTRGADPVEVAAAPPPAETLVEGGLLGGLYRVGRVLGRGGMGVVFEAWDLGLERKVAIKQLRTPDGAQEDYDRFLKEARLVARLQHPNIVQIHTLVEDNSLLYLVFELVEGRGLDAVLAEKGRFSPAEAWAAVRDVCAALDCAHEARIIHRDLKPSNIMLTAKGAYKVMDFGIAHQAQSELMLTQTGAWGTPPYMAPEQERGLVSRESDLYALGCTVYELLTGGRPFGPGADKTTQSFKPVSTLVHGLPPAMDAFMKQALAPDPAFRFHTGREFLAAFQGALNGRVAA
ncbi:tetratricopeptide repeat protein [bacterium]|nr:MAG: tetratricopeptide repeat protein [bacterium]